MSKYVVLGSEGEQIGGQRARKSSAIGQAVEAMFAGAMPAGSELKVVKRKGGCQDALRATITRAAGGLGGLIEVELLAAPEVEAEAPADDSDNDD